jgi:hypothetical protein
MGNLLIYDAVKRKSAKLGVDTGPCPFHPASSGMVGNSAAGKALYQSIGVAR